MKFELAEMLKLSDIYIYRPQRSCGKAMFSQASVILSTGGCRHPPRTRQTPPLPCRPTGRDGHCSRRYASYWNAFLFKRLRYRPSQNEIYSQVHRTTHGRVKHVRLNFFTPSCLILTFLGTLNLDNITMFCDVAVAT